MDWDEWATGYAVSKMAVHPVLDVSPHKAKAFGRGIARVKTDSELGPVPASPATCCSGDDDCAFYWMSMCFFDSQRPWMLQNDTA